MINPVQLDRTHDQWDKIFAVQSESNPSKFYTLGHNSYTGGWACDCPAWIYHTPRKPCKHIRFLLAFLETASQPGRASNVTVALDLRAANLKKAAEEKFDSGRAKFIEL